MVYVVIHEMLNRLNELLRGLFLTDMHNFLTHILMSLQYVIVISRARGMYGIYCPEARGREAAQGLSAINAMHPECT